MQAFGRLSLTWRFALTALLVVVLLGLVLAWLLNRAIVAGALDDGRAEARDTAAVRALAFLRPDDLTTPLSPERLAAFDRFVQDGVLSKRTVNVVIWDHSGRVIYSNDHAEIGWVFTKDDERDEALEGKTVSEVTHGVSHGTSSFTGRLLEVYTPIVFPGTQAPAGVFEIYQDYAPVAQLVGALQRTMLLSLVAGMAILYLTLLWIVRGADRRLRGQHEALERSLAERTRLTAILEATTDIVTVADPTGKILYLNNAARRLLGVDEAVTTPALTVFDAAPRWARARLRDEAIPAAVATGAWSGETALLSGSGEEVPVSQVVLAHTTPAGNVDFFSTVARDIGERKQFEARLVHLATHDALTGLYNRRRFEEELERQLRQAQHYATHGAVLFLDLDGFKVVNDTLGHRAGDQLLTGLAGALPSAMRETDTLARLGGDEFAVLLPHSDVAQAWAVAERLLRVVESYTPLLNGQPVRTTTSIGIALYPEHGMTGEDLLVHADLAMYQAKAERNTAALYAPDHELRAEFTARRLGEHRLRKALDEGRLTFHAQPIQSLHGDHRQYELLLRLVDEDGQLVMPDAFLPVAERSDLIHAIDRWVVREAIAFLAFAQQIGDAVSIEVNLSGRAFTDKGLLTLIRQELAETGVNSDRLIFEITETAAIADLHQARTFITTLKQLGCRFAIDDFGVGFSSFAYLKYLPVDYLKLDGSFIRNLPRDATDQHLVRAMVEVARGLSKQTIAEFVGDAATLQLLTAYGVDYAQGYYVGRPIPLVDILPEPGGERRAA